MKTTTVLLLMTALVAVSCKKHKDAPSAVKPVIVGLATYIKGEDNANLPIWCSINGEAYTIYEIGTDKSLQEKIVFGYYKDNNGWGLYAPATYSVPFEQQLWAVQNSTIFKKPPFSPKEFQSTIDNDSNAINYDFINKAFLEGEEIGYKVKGFEVGDVFVFQGIEGKQRGLVRIKEFYNKQIVVAVEIWIP